MFQLLAALALAGTLSPGEALRSMTDGMPVSSAQSPAAMEFGAEFLLPEDPSLTEHAILRQFHRMAFGMQPDGVLELADYVAAHGESLSKEAKLLWLEFAASAGIPAELPEPDGDNLTMILRYCAEKGVALPAIDRSALTGLQRLYLVKALSTQEANAFVSDPLWAVRLQVLQKSAEAANSLLDDPSPAVRLAAARATGRVDILLQLSSMDGPAGHMALASLGQVPILTDSLFRSPDPAKRAASLISLLDLGWRIPPERLDYLLTDGYFMVGAITADASGMDYAMPEGAGLPENLPALQDVPDAVRIVTDAGVFEMDLLKEQAPVTCRSFWHLARGGFYDGIYFHRVIPGFVAQAGCPEGNGYGGPGYSIPAEHNTAAFRRGTVGMADSGPGTGGSQFFIMLDSHRRLDCRYTAFGRLRDHSGVDLIETGTVILEILPVNP